ncbi:hypothetical protein NST41_24970 [Paenibacillus sp. FSL L8-0696]|uniref:hypothetical protein n=1 Tax=Paenibacillus sp. FSL L8-0696 TaxID=2954524 RepID=UPI003119DD8D
MKRIFQYSALLLLVLLISSCGKTDTNSSSGSASESPANTNTNTNTNTSADAPSYFGEWSVQGLVGSTPVSAAEDEKLIGMRVTYSIEKASFDKDEIMSPEYKEENITKDDFFNEYRNELSDLGIETESVKTVSINNWTNPGSSFIVKDDQTMIFLWDGNYYEMKKEKK